MSAALIDGKAVAASLRERIADDVADFAASAGRVPGLAVVLVGDDAASAVYVRNKAAACAAAGIAGHEHRLPADTSEEALLAVVLGLNADPSVDGILVQLPLPPQIDASRILAAISADKDVDGFHATNAGRLATGLPGFVPCTPLGCLHLIRSVGPDLRGAEAVVIGRSNIVGKPMAALLLGADCTVTIAHSRTRDLPEVARRADILVAAVGRPEMVRGDWVKPGAIVIDVGINRIASTPGRTKLVGDVHFAEASAVARAITPVPGGVGPMTIAMLLANTLEAARRHAGLA
ncbi:bifunctional methylenetetrahydrofolate dehydrogenase/methenyltetrahydrofolate cyclohydrolase FolD [Sphingomonas jatrophae]|uniref:Bifunctional protein FolD n=1 Tax=Sphingomonas jatrophae TaxID=1166337 RepID=A0A1I6LR16_9SPHN|nr:bifunctional methylenetetrahydrofolate dehydrogenase/methenyltetrahydrofolate cyclohydrolase FolD [Sphingomonas jatrophae]SFS05935.1 methylenetetrahydrofolate dehydrogenase (NADP+) / methenyltetrahydrofolate cyclohydrolase [Sphingomonas jatrophae]